MEFLHAENLFLLIILPLLLSVYIWRSRARQKNLKRVFGKNSLFLATSLSSKARFVKISLVLAATALFIFALARPQWIGEKSEMQSEGVYMVLAVDISTSMLAEDIKPSRLSFMKRELARFVQISEGDKIAIIAFAGSAVLISPFTNDLSIVKLYLKDLTPDYLSSKGSNFRQLFPQIKKAFQSLKSKPADSTARIVLLASDGEDHDEVSPSSIDSLLKQNIRFFTLSVGTKEGGIIPMKNKKGRVVSYKRNAKGEVVVTKLKTKVLKRIAEMSKGAYYHLNPGGASIDQLRSDIDEFEKAVFDSHSLHKKKELYQWFLSLGLLLAFLELLIGVKRKAKASSRL